MGLISVPGTGLVLVHPGSLGSQELPAYGVSLVLGSKVKLGAHFTLLQQEGISLYAGLPELGRGDGDNWKLTFPILFNVSFLISVVIQVL